MMGWKSPWGWGQALSWTLCVVLVTLSEPLFVGGEVIVPDINAIAGEFEAAFQGKCGPSSPCLQLCVELHDGTFECHCRPGYRLLLDGYSCVELNNSTYPDEDGSDELDDIDYSSSDKPSVMKAKISATIIKAVTPPPSSSEPDLSLEGRPLPRPIASSTYQKGRKKGKTKPRNNEMAKAAAKAAETKEMNAHLKKFSPIDDPNMNVIDFFGLDPDVSAKATAKMLKPTIKTKPKSKDGEDEYSGEDSYSSESDEDEDDDGDGGEEDDEDATNEAEEDMDSMEESKKGANAAKANSKGVTTTMKNDEHLGGNGGERIDEDYSDSSEGFILPPRALPLSSLSSSSSNGNDNAPASKEKDPTSFTPSEFEKSPKGDAPSLLPKEGKEAESTLSPLEECPLKCVKGICAKEGSEEAGFAYRCLCPMGLRGTFCEIEEQFEEGTGYNSGLFRGKSWAAFPVLHDAYMADQISLEFRPQSPNGILLLTGERDDLSGDYLALFLKEGFLEFRFDCGSGSGVVRSSSPVKLEQWNKASIVRRRWDGWMQLNDGPFTQGRSKGLFSRITFRQPVYIGGQGNITFNSLSSIQSNFDDEPELAASASVSSTQENGVGDKGIDAFSPSTTVTAALAPSTPEAVSSPENAGGEMEDARLLAEGAKDKDKNAGDDEGTISILKRVGGFQGCIRNLVINDRLYRFGLEPAGDNLQGFDIENCNDQGVCDLVKCQHGGQCMVQKDTVQCLCPLGFSGTLCETPLDLQIPSFNGSSYLKYGGLGLTRVLSWLEMEVVIKPDGMDGLIMYNGYKTDGMGDFISLVIDQGYIEFAMDLGTGTAIIRSDSPISLGAWHHIHVSRTSRLISLRIDNQPPLMALTPGAFTQLSLPHNLFLGGIPDVEWLSPKVKVQGGFTGCIQKLVINEKPLRIMGSAMSGVNLENCEHPCLRNPCDHGGDCVPKMANFQCHCPLGFRDSYCQTKMDKEDVITAPKFIGDSYLRFTHPRIIKRLSGWRLNLSFRLKTDSSRGLLVWAGRKWMTSASDFISMGLRNGFVTASFSLGSGQTTIAYNHTAINDGRWHRVILVRNEQEASLTVDDGPPIIGVAPGKLRQLNINDGLFIGGLEESRHQSVNRYMEGFVGCLTDLVLGSERVALLQEASEGRNVDYCD